MTPRCFDHLVLPVADLEASRAFYDAVCTALGWAMEIQQGAPSWGPPGAEEFIITQGSPPPDGLHLAFHADTREQVQAFHAAGLAAGARDNGPPGLRPQYSGRYYAAFLVDPDGNNVEAVCHEEEPSGVPPS
jgi:catechol 2,3-dioxygenase-like lactoylglutathione lyase family enzyme